MATSGWIEVWKSSAADFFLNFYATLFCDVMFTLITF